jgi:rRNA biogenesis protein RRP5
MNVYVAQLNLENSFGSPEQLEAAFLDACKHMDPEKMHFHLIAVYDRADKTEQADQVFQVLGLLRLLHHP